MSNLYRGPSIDASYQVSVDLAKRFQRRRILRNQPIRNKNCLWRPCLLTDRDEMSNLYRGPSIDASYQVSIHLAKGFQRRRLKCEKVNRRWMPSDGKSSHCFSQGEIKTGIESPCVSKFYLLCIVPFYLKITLKTKINFCPKTPKSTNPPLKKKQENGWSLNYKSTCM